MKGWPWDVSEFLELLEKTFKFKIWHIGLSKQSQNLEKGSPSQVLASRVRLHVWRPDEVALKGLLSLRIHKTKKTRRYWRQFSHLSQCPNLNFWWQPLDELVLVWLHYECKNMGPLKRSRQSSLPSCELQYHKKSCFLNSLSEASLAAVISGSFSKCFVGTSHTLSAWNLLTPFISTNERVVSDCKRS